MKVALAGPPDFTNEGMMNRTLDDYHAKHPITLLIECGYRITSKRKWGKTIGPADYWARKWAESRGVPVETRAADWDTYGPAAGPRRNREIIANDKPDAVIVFPGVAGKDNLADLAHMHGIPVWTIHEGRDALKRVEN